MYQIRARISLAGAILLLATATQAAQHNQSDLDFIARMNKEATDMYEQANKLDAKLAAVDKQEDGRKKRNQIRDNIKMFKSQVRDEQKHLDGKDFKKEKSRKDQEKRMAKMQEQLRQIEADMYVLGYAPKPGHN